MATTTLLQRHAGEGETIAEAIRDCLDYGKDPEKTESGKYISAYECDPATVADEFLLAKASYAAMTGREQKKENNVLCYQIRQSFYPGEITPKEANRIGYELAMRWTKGRHAFIVTTHTDKQHIHAFGMIPGLEPDEWSNDACRGYVIMAMENCGFSKKDIRRVVGQLYEIFDLNSVEDAKEKYHSSPY